jgi:hypothetical protein
MSHRSALGAPPAGISPGFRLLCAGLAALLAGPIASRPGLAAPAPAPAAPAADPARAEALRLVREGAQLFDRGRFAGALEKFEAAYQRFASPKIQFNIGQAARKLRQSVKSTLAFEAFLRGVEQPTPEDRAEAEAALREMAAAVARLEIAVQPAGASVRLDGSPLGTTPLPAAAVVAPGAHEIVVEHAGHQPLREAIAVRGGETKRIERTLPSSAPPTATVTAPTVATNPSFPPAPPAWSPPPPGAPVPPAQPAALDLTASAQPSQRPLVGKILLGAGLAFAAGAVALLISARSKADAAEAAGCGPCEDEANAIDTRSTWSKVLFGAAGAAGIAGTTLILLPRRTSEPGRPALGQVSLGFAGKF